MSAYEEDLGINIHINLNATEAEVNLRNYIRSIEEVAKAETALTFTKEQANERWKEAGQHIREETFAMQTIISPVRSLSWDFMLMGRGLSILNTHLLGGNKEFERYIGILYTAASILRIVTSVADVYRVIVAASVVLTEWQAQAELKAAAAISAKSAAMGQAMLIQAAYYAVGAAGAPFTGGLSLAIPTFLGALTSAQHGMPYVPQTGPYLLHKGEAVIPANQSYSTITINMYPGNISSNVDVDNMLRMMSFKMAAETRRRGM